MTVVKYYSDETTYEVSGIGYEVKKEDKIKEKNLNLDRLFKIGMLCNTSQLGEHNEPIGDPTEVALLVSGMKY